MKRAASYLSIAGGFILIGFLTVLLSSLTQAHQQCVPGTSYKLVVGKEVEYGTLFSIAQQQGFFHCHGLDVTLNEYASGAPAFADMLAGKVDMIDAADFVGVKNSFTSKDFVMLASVGVTTDSWEIVGRADHGIHTAADFRGKTIGVPAGTLGEFFLSNFLLINQISPEDIKIVNFSPQDLVTQLQNGTLDGVMIFQPYAFQVRQALASKAAYFAGQTDRPNYIMLYARKSFVQQHPDIVKKFVASLVDAQDFLQQNPQQLTFFMKHEFGYSDAYITSVISSFKFYVGLEQPLLPLLEDEAQWAIDTKQTTATKIPNYLDYISFDALNTVRPEAITMIR